MHSDSAERADGSQARTQCRRSALGLSNWRADEGGVFLKGIVPLSRGLAMLSPEVVSQSRPLLSTCSTALDMSNDLSARASTAAGVKTSLKPMSICTGM